METLNPQKSVSKDSNSSTQRYVNVEEVRDGVIVLKNGALRSVLLVSSLNFDLKSAEEQDAIILQYQNFLNSLDFPVQVVISSRRFDIRPYIELLKDKENHQRNELLRLQISEYQNFIKNLAEVSNIMSKLFYLVIPFSPVEDKEKGLFHSLTTLFNPSGAVLERREFFETYKNQLWQRVDHVSFALSQTGVRVAPLNTEELIELLYNSYNPSLFTTRLTKNIEAIDLEIER
jgi:type IV secretory pathway VirB4 component